MKKIIPIIFILIIAYLGIYAYSLSKVEIKSVEFDEITKVNSSGFTLDGYAELYNGGIMPVKIDHIEYQIVLESTEEVLSKGVIEGQTVKPKESIKFDALADISWIPAKDAALELIRPGETNATVSGDAYVSVLGFIETRVPFEETVDLEPFLKEAIEKKMDEMIKDIFN